MALFKKEKRAAESTVDESALSAELIKALIGSNTISKDKALEIPEVAASINIIANIVSNLPIKLYKRNEGNVEEIKSDKRLFLLNRETGDTLTSQQMWRSVIEDYYLGKGAYIYINDDVSLNYIDEKEISINENEDPIFKKYQIMVAGKTYYPHQFIKILRKTKRGMKSKSIIEEHTLMLSVVYASLILERNMAKKGGKKSGFFKSDKPVSKDAMLALKEAFRNAYATTDDNCIVLNNGMDFKETTNTAAELQLNEQKRANSPKIAMLFNIPEKILNGSASAEDVKNLIKFAITPVLNDIEASLDRDYLTEKEKQEDYYYAFEVKELTRGSIKERYEAYGIAIDKNIMQIDEVRAEEDLKPLGFNYIKLGLDTVLYDPKNKTIYTPNTGQREDLSKKGGENENRG